MVLSKSGTHVADTSAVCVRASTILSWRWAVVMHIAPLSNGVTSAVPIRYERAVRSAYVKTPII